MFLWFSPTPILHQVHILKDDNIDLYSTQLKKLINCYSPRRGVHALKAFETGIHQGTSKGQLILLIIVRFKKLMRKLQECFFQIYFQKGNSSSKIS